MSTMSVNPDIQKERDTASFDVESLTNVIDGDKVATKRRREIQALGLKESVFTEGEDGHFLSREELFDRAVQKGVRLWQMVKEHDLYDKNDLRNLQAIAFPSEAPPTSLHWVMFIPTLEAQASDEQREKWLPKALSGELFGTYAQTEMGHGTHIRALETTATYDPATEEFVVHSPTLSSMKWWPGGLGKTSNCCIVMANLITQGQNYGMHAFFVQIRRPEDHQPYPGITVGDIGPKFGYNSIDNGFLKLDQFRIPRTNMLLKHSEVMKDGTYVRTSTQKKPAYSVMTQTRAALVDRTARALSAAVTIAIRYSAVRRQSELKPGDPEPQILDYQTQQYKLFPYLSMSYGFLAVAKRVSCMYDQAMAQLSSNNDQLLPELHALSSGLKAYCSGWMSLGIEQCRLACGGHGYSQASGLPKLYVVHTPICTFEGENTVLFLQAARYLIKCYQLTQSNSEAALPDSVSYLAKRGLPYCSLDKSMALEKIVESFQHRSRHVIQRAATRIQDLVGRGVEEWQARNETGVELVRAVKAHCEAYIIEVFAEHVRDLAIVNPELFKVMKHLCQLLAAYWIDNSSGDFLEDEYMTKEHVDIVQHSLVSSLAAIRPNAVPLVDAFDFTDHYLCSVLGRYDGQVYENLYKWALKSPLNKTQVHESYDKYLKPMMSSKL